MSPVLIFGFAGSTYVRVARAICVEKGIPYELVPVEFLAESHRARHPFLKMPALEHEGTSLFETLAIATYLDGLSATPALQPADPVARATMMQWISVAIDYLYTDLVRALLEETVADGAVATAVRDLDVLERRLSASAFLAGDRLSLADLFVAPMVEFAANRDPRFVPTGHHAVVRWLASTTARESFQSTAARAEGRT
jgi:glutathione S-transferase